MPLFQTDRTYLRRFQENDLSQIIEMEANPDVMVQTGPGRAQTTEESRLRLDKILNHEPASNLDGYFAVIEKTTNQLIAWFMLLPIKDKEYEIGFMVNQKFWRKGFAYEVCKMMIEKSMATDRIDKFIARASSANLASISLLKKCHFKQVEKKEGTVFFEIVRN